MRSLVLIVAALACRAWGGGLPPGFDPAKWPGRMPRERAAELSGLIQQLRKAQRDRDASRLGALAAEFRRRLGPYAGVPETRPEYGGPINPSAPDPARVEKICWESFQALRGFNGWERAIEAKKRGQAPPRIRVSFRNATSDLRLFEAGGAHADEYKTDAIRGFDYIAGRQTTCGAFGYPYDPKATEGLESVAAAIAREGKKRGLKMAEGDWLIEDLEEGGLQFDNGEAGAGLLHAYALTGDRKYLDAARRAGDWASARMLVPNWNYNSYSGWLLARLYRATGENKYLEAAIAKFDFGVLPGQMENGRWVDQHNASPQYHALMARNLVEYSLALSQARHPQAAGVKKRTQLALDSMAGEINAYGPPNVNEGLPLEALAIGLMAFGRNAQWEKAADTYANYLLDHLMPERIERNQPRPETLAAYLLWQRVRDGRARSCEVSFSGCLKER